MEKELKIAELAALWGVSVPTTWNRIRKEGLTIFMKKNESNKDVNYVRVSDEIINQYVINDNNNVYKDVNNGYYEDMLINNNVNSNVNNPKSLVNTEYTIDDLKDLINTITTVNNDYNNRLEHYKDELIKAYNELSTVKSQQLLLEDKAGREGLYINEINELKKNNNRYKLCIKGLLTLIVLFAMVIVGYGAYTIGENNKKAEIKKAPDELVQNTQAHPMPIAQPAAVKK